MSCARFASTSKKQLYSLIFLFSFILLYFYCHCKAEGMHLLCLTVPQSYQGKQGGHSPALVTTVLLLSLVQGAALKSIITPPPPWEKEAL